MLVQRDAAAHSKKVIYSENRELRQQLEALQKDKSQHVQMLQSQKNSLQLEYNELYAKLQAVQRDKIAQYHDLQGTIKQLQEANAETSQRLQDSEDEM